MTLLFEPLLRGIDAHEIAPNLWQGSFPSPGLTIRNAGFDVIVLCARELQVSENTFPGVRVIYAPNDDSVALPLTRDKLRVAIRAAGEVAQHVREGRKVLVTCAAGLNRSGLVTGLALYHLFGWPGEKCLETVRTKRVLSKRHPGKALCNAEFAQVIRRL